MHATKLFSLLLISLTLSGCAGWGEWWANVKEHAGAPTAVNPPPEHLGEPGVVIFDTAKPTLIKEEGPKYSMDELGLSPQGRAKLIHGLSNLPGEGRESWMEGSVRWQIRSDTDITRRPDGLFCRSVTLMQQEDIWADWNMKQASFCRKHIRAPWQLEKIVR